MKKLRYIFSFLNKKGVFGLVVGIVFVLAFSRIVFADEVIDALPSDSVLICEIPGSYQLYVRSQDFDVSKMCWAKNNSDYSWYYLGPNLSEVYYKYEYQGVFKKTSMNDRSMTPFTDIPLTSPSLYVFESISDAQAYLNGEIDASSAVNFEEVQNFNRSFTYDSDLPYYDKTSLSLNTDKTCLLDANMSTSQRDLYNSFSTDSGSPFLIELYSHAIYAKTTELGNFNAFVLMYGTENDLGNKLPNSKKVDDIIKFDSSGRLIVNGEQGFMGGGGRHGDSFVISDSSPLIAYTFEQVTFRDGLSATSHFTRDVSYVGTEIDGYILIGYMTEICLVYPDGNDVRYGRKTYSYTWLTQALRDRYGSQSSFYDGDGVKFEGEDYVFDEYGNEVDSTYSGSNITNDNVIDYIKNGYGLTGTDGYIEMSRRFFIGVPDFIWGIIAFALSINVIVILFKVFRGM